MNIAIIGYGKMGKLIAQKAAEYKHNVTATVDPFERSAMYKHISQTDFSKIDCALEFTGPDAVLENVKILAGEKIPIVIGSTGWLSKMDEVKKIINETGSSLLWSSNFSIGINIFYKIASFAASLIDPFTEYDVSGLEIHHNEKIDSPSGTAKAIASKLLSAMSRKTEVVWDRLERAPNPNEIHFSSLRSGSATGMHSLIFDSPSDTIEIKHSARNRDSFASGALVAANWLVFEKREGIFTMEDIL